MDSVISFLAYWWRNIVEGWSLGNNFFGILQSLLAMATVVVWARGKFKSEITWEGKATKVIALLFLGCFIVSTVFVAPFVRHDPKADEASRQKFDVADMEGRRHLVSMSNELYKVIENNTSLSNQVILSSMHSVALSNEVKAQQEHINALQAELGTFRPKPIRDRLRSYIDKLDPRIAPALEKQRVTYKGPFSQEERKALQDLLSDPHATNYMNIINEKSLGETEVLGKVIGGAWEITIAVEQSVIK